MVSINTNIASLQAQNNTRQVNNDLEKAMERLSSGLRINSAGDDAAGLAIASRMESQVRGLQAAIKNANDGISVTQVAEGAMEEIGNILQRMRELAVQSANDSNSDSDRAFLQQEVAQLSDEITRISQTTQFNGQNVLDGSYTNKAFQIGANASQTVALSISNVGASSLGIGSSTSTSSSSTTTTTTGVAEVVGTLSFSRDDVYNMQITDGDTGYSYRIGQAATTASAVSSANETATFTGHSFRTGDKITATTNDDIGTAGTTERFIIVVDENTVQFATTLGNALNGTTIDIDGAAGTATAPVVTGVGLTLTRADADSRADFAERINIGLKEAATNTTITADSAAGAAAAATFDAANADDKLFTFDLTVSGVKETIDLKNRILTTASSTGAVTYAETVSAMRNEIQNVFDESLVVSQSSGVFTITDLQGRALEVGQGTGLGYFFGTDEQNNGVIDTAASTQNNLSVEWNSDGTALNVLSASAGSVQITNFASTSTGTATFDVADTASTDFTEPVVLEDTLADTTASVRGVIGESKIALNFSNTFGNAADGTHTVAGLSATYGFKITDGVGNHYIAFTASSLLNIQESNNSDAAIKSAVEANLAAQILVGAGGGTFNDNRISADEFEIDYANGVLTIVNTEGRDLAVEEFSSAFGTATVSKLDGLEGTVTLSSRGALPNEVRIGRGYFSTAGISATSAVLNWTLDGGTAMATDIKGVWEGTAASDTALEQAGLLEAELQAGTASAATQAGSALRVTYDSNTDEFVIVDTLGREIGITSLAQAAGDSAGKWLNPTGATAHENKDNDVVVASGATSGVLTEGSSIKLTFNQDNISSFVLGVNGQTTTAATFNFSTDTFSGNAFNTILNNLVDDLNAEYDGTPFSYSMDQANRALTITNTKGGEIFLDGHTTDSVDLEMKLEVLSGVLQSASDTSGDGDAVIKANEAVTAVEAEGDGSVDTSSSTSTSYSSSSSGSTTGIDQISIATQSGATAALDSIDAALNSILSERAMIGALENRLDHTVNNLSNVSTNTQAAQGRIQDADFAKETTQLTKSQILSQAATSMLAQANQSKQYILALLQ